MGKVKLFNYIIGEWAENYPPANEKDEFVIKLSSEEIKEELNNFISVKVDEITEFLVKNGYSIVKTKDGEIKWIISNRKRSV